MTEQPLTRENLTKMPTRLLRNGRSANARVTCVTAGQTRWTVKDFIDRSFFVRHFIAPLLLKHEMAILSKLQGIRGIAREVFAIDRYAIAISYAEGTRLEDVDQSQLSVQFFEEMEKILLEMHSRDVAHLDTRGTGNWLVSGSGNPLLIDFQSAISLTYLPARLREIIELIDLSGVYKKWALWQPDTMGKERMALYMKGEAWRKRWVFKGYFGRKKNHFPK